MLAIRWCVATCVRFTPSGIVLLQNPEAILPLKKGTKVLVAGPMYGPFLFVFWLRLYRALRDYSCGCRGFLEDRMMDIITGRAPPPARLILWVYSLLFLGLFLQKIHWRLTTHGVSFLVPVCVADWCLNPMVCPFDALWLCCGCAVAVL